MTLRRIQRLPTSVGLAQARPNNYECVISILNFVQCAVISSSIGLVINYIAIFNCVHNTYVAADFMFFYREVAYLWQFYFSTFLHLPFAGCCVKE